MIERLDVREPALEDAGPSIGAPGACLVWRFPTARRGVSSAIVGGGIGEVSWVLNVTVDDDYGRMDPDDHLLEISSRLGLTERGVALMTAVDVGSWSSASIDGAAAWATVGVRKPVWAAEPGRRPSVASVGTPGTINLVVEVPARLTDAALVNAVTTITEAKVQALFDQGIAGTGTASDAVCVVCGAHGPAEQFGGPRSTWGARLAQAAYDAVSAGVARQRG